MSRPPLTARVAVNRWWQMYFGAGLVKTAEDFGATGEAPSHPELLDYLATELISSGWDVRAMQRRIVMSAAYRQSSRITPMLAERDPENRLLARGSMDEVPPPPKPIRWRGAASRVTRPVQSLAQAARRVAGGDWSARVEVSSRDELGQLAGGGQPGAGLAVGNGAGPRVAAQRLAAAAAPEAVAPDATLALPVEELQLPVRAFNSLRREGIHTVGDLSARTEAQLRSITNLGPQSIKEIKQKLAERGLGLAGAPAGAGRPAPEAGGGAVKAGTAGTAAGAAARAGAKDSTSAMKRQIPSHASFMLTTLPPAGSAPSATRSPGSRLPKNTSR